MANPERDLWASAVANDVVRLGYLLAGGEDANQRDDRGLTPLHAAATCGAVEAAKLLLVRGANPNASDWESGWTPLHRSFYFGHVKLSLLLMKHGATLGDEYDNDWRRDLSMNRPHSRSIKSCSQWDIHDHDGNTPLDLLSEHLKPSLRENSCHSEVFTFGKSDFQLGIPLPNGPEVLRPKRIDDLSSLRVSSLAAAKHHSLALTSWGDVYSWGHGRGGRLGHGDEHVRPAPHRIAGLAGRRVVKIAAAENHTLAITSDGELFTWGSDRFGQLGHGNTAGKSGLVPRKVDFFRRSRVIDAAAGASHTIAATSDGDVYTWGSNKNGQLGLRELEMSNSIVPAPRVVEFSGASRGNHSTMKRSVIQVAAGPLNSIVIAAFNNGSREVYQWGWTVNSPHRISFTQHNSQQSVESYGVQFHTNMQPTITQVAAGKYHNVAVSSWGHVYSWGIGADILGHGTNETFSTKPQLVEALLPENGGGIIVHIAASTNRTCAVTSTGDLFSWGTTEEAGVLGNGSGRYQPVPKRVVGVKRVVSACVGEDHTLALLAISVPALPHSDVIATSTGTIETSNAGGSGTLRSAKPTSHARFLLSEEYQPSDPDLIEIPDVFDMDEDMEDQGNEAEEQSQKQSSEICVLPTLQQICERVIASQIDTKNAITMLTNAEMLSSEALVHFTVDYIRQNLDAILVLSKQGDINLLLEDVGDQVHDMLQSSLQSPDHSHIVPEQRSKSSPQQLVEDPAVLGRAIKATKKKLATIEELEQLQTSGKRLLPEQTDKLSRKTALEKELRSLDQRLTLAEKRQQLKAAAAASQPTQVSSDVTPPADGTTVSTPDEQAREQSKSTPSKEMKGRRKFVPLQKLDQSTPPSSPQVSSPASDTTSQSAPSVPRPNGRVWGELSKAPSSPIPIHEVSPATKAPSPAFGARNSPLTPAKKASTAASSPSASVSLAAFLTQKPKRKAPKSGVEEMASSPSDRRWNVTAPAAGSPGTGKSLLDIQREQEHARVVSVAVHHDGNESAWLVERRARANSLGDIIGEQEAIAAVEQFERMEREREEQLKKESEAQQRKGNVKRSKSHQHQSAGRRKAESDAANSQPRSAEKKRHHKARGQIDTVAPTV